MKAKDLRDMGQDELAAKENDLIQELFNLRFQFFTGQLENTSRLTAVKRDIARVKTIRREFELKRAKDGQ